MTTLALWLHVVAAAAWLGGNLIMLMIPGLMAQGGPPAMLATGRTALVLGRVFFTPAAIVTLLTGIWLVIDIDAYSFSEPFVSLGFAAVLIIMIGSFAVLIPTGRKMIAAMEAGDGATAQALAPRQSTMSVINSLVLLVTIYGMVARWGA
jgi:uncharacterized membrane protein